MKKIKLILLFTLFVMFMVTNKIVYAAESYNVKIEPNSEEIKPGDTLTVSLRLSDITIPRGIGAILGKIEYDKDVLKKIESSDIKSGDGWSEVIYNNENESEGKFTVERQSGYNIKTENILLNITFKALDDAKLGDTKIKLSGLCVSDGENDYEIEPRLATIKIIKSDETKPETKPDETKPETKPDETKPETKPDETKPETKPDETNPETKPDETKTVDNNINNEKNNSTDNTKVTKDKQQNSNSKGNTALPYAGNDNLIWIIIFVIIGISIFTYIKYRKLKNI